MRKMDKQTLEQISGEMGTILTSALKERARQIYDGALLGQKQLDREEFTNAYLLVRYANLANTNRTRTDRVESDIKGEIDLKVKR